VRLAAPAAFLVVLSALVAGCGGGGTTTVIDRTVTEKAPVEAASGGGEGGGKEQAVDKEATSKRTEEKEEAQEPKRIVHLQTFRSPSGNIGCVMFEGGARCDIREREWSPPPRPASCSKEVDFGQGLNVGRVGKARFVCAGDTALDPSASVLSYGTGSEVGGSECISRSDGMTCLNQAGHGFFISIQSYRVF
jgi:hypothetical protein